MMTCPLCYKTHTESTTAHVDCIQQFFGTNQLPIIDFKQNALESMAIKLLGQHVGIPGVQKKLSTQLLLSANNEAPRLTITNALEGYYIFKPASKRYPFMPEVEDLSMHLAEQLGIETAQHGLIPFAGNLAYITQRFDRTEDHQKIPVEDCCQLSRKLTADKYKFSMEKLGKVIIRYATFPGEEIIRFIELTLFNFIIGNADMHLKNFSMYTDSSHIRLTPAYDLLSTKLLVPNTQDPEDIALPLNGKKTKLRKKDFQSFMHAIDAPPELFDKTIERFQAKLPMLQETIQHSFLSNALKEQFSTEIEARLLRLAS